MNSDPIYSDEWFGTSDHSQIGITEKCDFSLSKMDVAGLDISRWQELIRSELNRRTPEPCSLVENHKSIQHPYWSGLAIKNYSPYSTDYFCKGSISKSLEDHKGWQADAKRKFESSGIVTLEDLKFYDTELAEPLSEITEFIYENICSTTYRTYLLFLKPSGLVDWHVHSVPPVDQGDSYQSKYLVHIPIETNPKARFYVKNGSDVQSVNMNSGDVWVFNHYLPHKAENLDPNLQRIHLVFYADPKDPVFSKHLRNLGISSHF